jgi:hypothetical protein
MLDSTLALGAFVGVMLLVLGVLNPIVILPVVVLLLLPLTLRLVAGMWSRFAPTPAATTGGPRVPSTREASYQPVSDPAERG